jgi:hypothetical protein
MSLRPENVRIVRGDGSEVILELALTGVDEEGYEHWAVATPVDFQAGDHVEIGVMPQMCCIEFPLEGWREAS